MGKLWLLGLMIRILRWWRPATYHVEVFKSTFGMCGYHDTKKFDNFKDAEARLIELRDLCPEEIMGEFGFVPSFLRILMVRDPNPFVRFRNAFLAR